MSDTTTQTTVTPTNFYAPREHIRAALMGEGSGFYDHLIRAIPLADRANLDRRGLFRVDCLGELLPE